MNPEFFIHASEDAKHLYMSRTDRIKSDAFSPCEMTPDDVDYEMSRGKHPQVLRLTGMNQRSFEYFVQHYAKNYRYLSFFKSQLISNFSPLEDLPNLEEVSVYWNIRADRLWNMQKNTSLKSLEIIDAKKITLKPDLIRTGSALEEIRFKGSAFNNFPMESLAPFAGMPRLKHLTLQSIRLNDKSMDVLSTLPSLERFDFDPGMLTTEEIACLAARFPQLSGDFMGPWGTEFQTEKYIRVSGFRKPTLVLPEQQTRLDKYIDQFNKLVEKYRAEL